MGIASVVGEMSAGVILIEWEMSVVFKGKRMAHFLVELQPAERTCSEKEGLFCGEELIARVVIKVGATWYISLSLSLSFPPSRPLHELPNPHPCPPPNEISVDYAASQSTNMSSFSVFEDESCADQSSLAPFHDSWSTAPHVRGGLKVSEQQQQLMGKEYHAPLEAPVMTREKRHTESQNFEQSFTQFDIRHPNTFEPVSTPMGARSGEHLVPMFFHV